MFRFEKEFLKILEHFHKSGALKHLVLVGSWVLLIYKTKYGIKIPPFTTRDIDFTIERPTSHGLTSNPPIHETLTKIGYTPQFSLLTNSERYIPAAESLENYLSIEFLCEPGRKINQPFRIKGFSIVVTPVRFQKILSRNTENVVYNGIPINIPLPVIWAIHKVAVSQLRAGADAELKTVKDLEGANAIVRYFGKNKIEDQLELFKGKFLNLFKKGWKQYLNRYPPI